MMSEPPIPTPFPEPTAPAASRAEVFLRYLDYFRSRLASKLAALPAAELGRSRLPSGWTPLELVKHLRYVELRWLEWGFEGRDFADPWGDQQDGRWQVGPEETLSSLLADLHDQAGRTRAVVASHDLGEVGQPGDRWDGADPATLERILFHLLQEYARHVGHLDVVVELATGRAGELFSMERAVPRAPRPVRAPRRAVSRSSPPRTGSRTRPGPRSRCAARCRGAGTPVASGRCPPRRACRWR
jgi:uncharacterized damage-inducible protein DinB